MKNILTAKAGDICNYWNKLVIVHRLEDEGWVEVIKIKNPNKPYEPVGEPFSVRVAQLSLVKSSGKKSRETPE